MPEDTTTSTGTDDTGATSTTTTATTTAAGDDTSTGLSIEDLKAFLEESGLKPEQVKGRLDASRKWEQRAKANATAAQRLAEIEKSNLSDSEKVAEAQVRAVEAELQLTRFRVAADKGLPASAAQFLTGDDEDAITAAAEDLIAFGKTQKTANAPDLKQGNRGKAPDAKTDPDAWFRSLRKTST
jgi:hypothetical protein